MSQPPINNLNRRMRFGTGLVLLVLLLGACASTPMPPKDALVAARDAIAIAEETGARQFAGPELDDARQQLRSAEQAVTEEDMVMAERLADQARIAAELAAAKSESSRAVAINREMKRSAEALTEEMRRTGEQQ